MDIRLLRNFIGGIDAREARNFTLKRAAIQTLGVALDAFFQGRVHEDLEKGIFMEALSNPLTLGADGRNHGNDADQTGIDHESRNFADSPDILGTIRGFETQIAVQRMAK